MPKYKLYEGGHEYQEIEAEDLRAALLQAMINVDRSNYPVDEEEDPVGTIWIQVRAVNVDDPEDAGERKVSCDPEAPKCSEDAHEFEAEFEIVGGLKDNPGVWGNGGGVRIWEACMHCGCGQLTDTWAYDPSDNEQGLTSVTFYPGKYAEELRAYRGNKAD